MALKPERTITETSIMYSLSESSGNAGAAVKILSGEKVALAPIDTLAGNVLGLLMQDVRNLDYSTTPENRYKTIAASGAKVGVIMKGVLTTDQCDTIAGAFAAGSGVRTSGIGQLIVCNPATVTTVSGGTITQNNPYMVGKVLAASGDLGMYGYIKVQVG
jgi:hypothetical protein